MYYICSAMEQTLFTFSFPLRLTTHQRTLVLKQIDGARKLYNMLTELYWACWDLGLEVALYESQAWIVQIRKSNPGVNLVHSQVRQDVNRSVHQAFSMLYKEKGIPSWRSKKRDPQAITFPQNCVWDEDPVVKGKIGERPILSLSIPSLGSVRIKDTWSIDPEKVLIRQCKIVYDPLKDGFTLRMTCLIDMEYVKEIHHVDEPTKEMTAYDFGAHLVLAGSDGTKVKNPRTGEEIIERIKELQKELQKHVKGSNSWERCKKEIDRQYRKLANKRLDFRHKVTTGIVSDNQAIALENLKTKNMTKSAKGTKANPGKNVRQKAGLNRKLAEVAFGTMQSMIRYKCALYGRKLYFVSARNTSITCSICGHKDKASRKTQATFCCTKCGHKENADINAAKNIRGRALSLTEVEKAASIPNPPCNSMNYWWENVKE